ncbi:MAG TPA: enoyl-CoA hydratase-related protein, partial [Gammaproteobacteria bacterium]|nr:enoyl-CoA hydratase-related protein [Gammaproteobacteria bacterium]
MDQALMGKYKNWKLESDADNILWLTLDRVDSSANSLNEAVLKEFDQILNTLRDNQTAKALIIQSGKPSGFSVGADISQFKQLTSEEQAHDMIRKTHEIFNKLEKLPLATVA